MAMAGRHTDEWGGWRWLSCGIHASFPLFTDIIVVSLVLIYSATVMSNMYIFQHLLITWRWRYVIISQENKNKYLKHTKRNDQLKKKT